MSLYIYIYIYIYICIPHSTRSQGAISVPLRGRSAPDPAHPSAVGVQTTIHVCMYIYIYKHICVYVCVYIYIYIYIAVYNTPEHKVYKMRTV